MLAQVPSVWKVPSTSQELTNILSLSVGVGDIPVSRYTRDNWDRQLSYLKHFLYHNKLLHRYIVKEQN